MISLEHLVVTNFVLFGHLMQDMEEKRENLAMDWFILLNEFLKPKFCQLTPENT